MVTLVSFLLSTLVLEFASNQNQNEFIPIQNSFLFLLMFMQTNLFYLLIIIKTLKNKLVNIFSGINVRNFQTD